MHRRYRSSTAIRAAAMLVALALAATACSSSGSEEIDLGDVDTEATAPPDTGADDDADDGVAADLGPPDYPELPLDPDPDSDIPIEVQEDFLELHRQYYDVVQEALHTGQFDPDRLALVMHGELLDETIAFLESNSDAAVVERSPDTEVVWTSVEAADNESIIVAQCDSVGPLTGGYDATTGRPTFEVGEETVGLLTRVTYQLVTVGAEGGRDFRATVIEASQPEEGCGA